MLLARNGHGKTTLLETISNLFAMLEGDINLHG